MSHYLAISILSHLNGNILLFILRLLSILFSIFSSHLLIVGTTDFCPNTLCAHKTSRLLLSKSMIHTRMFFFYLNNYYHTMSLQKGHYTLKGAYRYMGGAFQKKLIGKMTHSLNVLLSAMLR